MPEGGPFSVPAAATGVSGFGIFELDATGVDEGAGDGRAGGAATVAPPVLGGTTIVRYYRASSPSKADVSVVVKVVMCLAPRIPNES